MERTRPSNEPPRRSSMSDRRDDGDPSLSDQGPTLVRLSMTDRALNGTAETHESTPGKRRRAGRWEFSWSPRSRPFCCSSSGPTR